jgi:hypothetical protein
MRFVDELLQQAEARGEFKNLPGEGRPLNLESNPYGGDMQMAYKIVKDSGYVLGFIEERRKLVERIDRLREQLRQAAVNDTTFHTEVETLNRAIQSYNLKAPLDQFHLMPLDADWEIRHGRP